MTFKKSDFSSAHISF